MNDNFEIILRTAKDLADEYGNEGWTGDCNDFTQASSSISQQLTNLEVERLWDEFSNEELITNGMTFLFHRTGRDKIITVKNCP
jgi:hypothetical protein